MASVSEPNESSYSCLRNAAFTAGLFLACALLAWVYLNQPGLKMRPDFDSNGSMLKPALAWVAGHGFRSFETASPPVTAFLNQDKERLDASELNGISGFSGITGKFDNDRKYLVFSVGVAWRLFGVSWQAVRIFMSIVFGIAGVLIYGIFRLGATWRLSLLFLIPSLFSPIMLEQAHRLRSFCKAPFILAGILIVGYLVSRKMRPRTLLLLSAGLGLIVGVGIGFRQDPIICLPFAFVAILFGARGRISLPVRILAAILLIVSFVVPAWPHLRMTRETGGNNSFYLTQGFAQRSFSDLHLTPASYSPVYSEGDFIVHSLITHYYGSKYEDTMLPVRFLAFVMAHNIVAAHMNFLTPRVVNDCGLFNSPPLDIWSWKSEMNTRSLVYWLYSKLPADVIARGYAAPVRILRNLQEKGYWTDDSSPLNEASRVFCTPFARLLNYVGPLFAAAALLAICAVDLRLAAWALLILLYFCGYTSLEFQPRHAFHLNFAGYWAPAFLLSVLPPRLRRTGSSAAGTPVGPAMRRMLAFVSVTALVLGGLYQGARVVQYYQMKPEINKYYTADLEPVSYDHHAEDDREKYQVHLPDAKPVATQDLLTWALWPMIEPVEIGSQYLAADIEVAGGYADMRFEYRDPENIFDLYESYLYGLGQRQESLRIFFPVFDYPEYFRKRNTSMEFSTFDGFQLDAKLRLKALYRVRNIKDFPLLMTMALPVDRRDFRWYHGINPLSMLWPG